MTPTLDLGLLRDPALRPIGEKVERGIRLDHADGLVLYATDDLLGLGHLADFANFTSWGGCTRNSASRITPTCCAD